MAKHSDTAILILAAGESRRLGTPKQLLDFEGETLIHRIARQAAASNAHEVLVVLGHQAARVEPELHDIKNARTIHNPDYTRGMGTSIRAGVQALKTHDAILISVCDQPHLTTDIFNRLIARIPASPSGIVCARYIPLGILDEPLSTIHFPLSTAFGVPAIFASQHFPTLLALPDDAGAKVLLTANDVDSIDFPNGAIDIDTVEDLANI